MYIFLLLSIGKIHKYYFQYHAYKTLIHTTFIHKVFHGLQQLITTA